MEMRKRTRDRRKPKASAKDVLGESVREPVIPAKWRKHYHRLVELRDHLLRQRFELTQDALEEKPTFSTLHGRCGHR